jgi:hypothetical protein
MSHDERFFEGILTRRRTVRILTTAPRREGRPRENEEDSKLGKEEWTEGNGPAEQARLISNAMVANSEQRTMNSRQTELFHQRVGPGLDLVAFESFVVVMVLLQRHEGPRGVEVGEKDKSRLFKVAAISLHPKIGAHSCEQSRHLQVFHSFERNANLARALVMQAAAGELSRTRPFKTGEDPPRMASSAVAKHSAMPSETRVCVRAGTSGSAEQGERSSSIVT